MIPASNQPPNEDIRNALQILSDVATRPAAKVHGTRATLIAYGELTNVKKLLTHALAQLEAQPDTSASHNADTLAALTRNAEANGDFIRPMGVPSLLTVPLPRGWTAEYRREVKRWELKEGEAHRGLFDTFKAALTEARKLAGL
jgi:hypothetical protein